MVAFYLSTVDRHQTQPFWAFMFLPEVEDLKILVLRLNFLVDKILQTVPIKEWHSVNRWKGMHE